MIGNELHLNQVRGVEYLIEYNGEEALTVDITMAKHLIITLALRGIKTTFTVLRRD